MGAQFENQLEEYPKELINRSKTLRNGVVRMGESPLNRRRSLEDDGQCIFQEIPEPRLGVVYDSFDIQKFTIDKNLGQPAGAMSRQCHRC